MSTSCSSGFCWFYGVGSLAPRPSPNLEDQGISLSLNDHPWTFQQGDPASGCTTLDIALGIIWPLKPHHYVKVGILSGGHKYYISFKITITKSHVYIDIGWHWICNQCFYLGIWNNDRTKMIVLPSFQLPTRLNSQNTNETEFINELRHINLFMNIGISNWHNWFFDLT